MVTLLTSAMNETPGKRGRERKREREAEEGEEGRGHLELVAGTKYSGDGLSSFIHHSYCLGVDVCV